MEARLWTFDDIKDASRRHEEYRHSDNPIRHYFYGVALDMSGQEEGATEKYDAFRAEAQRLFGDVESAAAHYAGEGLALRGDERSSDHYANMARILRGSVPGAAGRSKTCVLM
ncbi:unnamed protein product [Ectocarpus sp. CCAP 1310/34]|nr:unnamed protein product [Ectocarpus sp. CCAP 1310/34]